jgi:hypothetical protein
MPRKSIISSDDVRAVNRTTSEAAPELDEAGFESGDIHVVQERDAEFMAREAKFMEDKVVVEIEGDEDPNSPVFVYLGHNGVSQYVKRGEPQTIKRKFLYSALAAKTVKFACAFGKDNSGNEFNRLSPNVKTTYRIRLVEDLNPQGGMKWVQQVASTA